MSPNGIPITACRVDEAFYAVVIHRSTKVSLQVGDDFHGQVTSRSFGQLPHFRFELLLAFLSPTDFPMDDREAEEGRFVEDDYFASGFVDDEFEALLEIAFDACQNAFAPSRATAHQDSISLRRIVSRCLDGCAGRL